MEPEGEKARAELQKKLDQISKISPGFAENVKDEINISEVVKDPFMLASLIYKLAQEREQTNKLIAQGNEKFDKILHLMQNSPSIKAEPPSAPSNNSPPSPTPGPLPAPLSLQGAGLAPGSEKTALTDRAKLLPLHDQRILSFVARKGTATADDVKALMKYKKQNAASFRLNQLEKMGFLQKIRSGKRMLFLVKK